ncbi:hypothetical protein [Echinicola rosea]|nr:hypothetical protein [Echinicola rosea]
MLFDWDEKPIGGWEYANGDKSKIIKSVAKKEQESRKRDVHQQSRYDQDTEEESGGGGSIGYECEYEIINWCQVNPYGDNHYLDSDVYLECRFTEESPESNGPRPNGGGYSLPSNGDGPNPPQTDEACYDPHPTIPGMVVPCVPLREDDSNLKVEVDQSFKNYPKLVCILEKLKVDEFIKKLATFNQTSQTGRNVILKVGPVPRRPGDLGPRNAETDDSLGPYHIQITLNQDLLDRSSLSLARTILHEMIHAELFVAVFHGGGSPIDGNFNSNFERYVEKYIGSTVKQHNYMAENMVSDMAEVLQGIHSNLGKINFLSNQDVKKEFPLGNIPFDFYKAMAWKGLKSTDKWKYHLPERGLMEKYQDLADDYLTKDCKK